MARPPLSDESPTIRFQMKITVAEIEEINEWRFANRVPSISEAIRRLVKAGLLAEGGA